MATLEKTKTIQLLEQCLADTYALALKSLNYHWNIESPNFYSLHGMFEDQYRELFTAIDDFAERIAALGFKAPATLSEYAKTTKIPDGNSSLEGQKMVADLLDSHNIAIESLKELREAASSDNDPETEGMASGRIEAHQKNAWMLRASA